MSFLDRNMCKGPGVEVCLGCPEKSEEVTVSGIDE